MPVKAVKDNAISSQQWRILASNRAISSQHRANSSQQYGKIPASILGFTPNWRKFAKILQIKVFFWPEYSK